MKERKIKTPVEYIHEKVGAAMFQIEGGMYSIDELEQMVADFKQATAIMDKHLERSMQEIKRVMKRNEP